MSAISLCFAESYGTFAESYGTFAESYGTGV